MGAKRKVGPLQAKVDALVARRKKAAKKRGCSWNTVLRDAQRALMAELDGEAKDGDFALSNLLLGQLSLIKGSVPRDVYALVLRAVARLYSAEMGAERRAVPPISLPPSLWVH